MTFRKLCVRERVSLRETPSLVAKLQAMALYWAGDLKSPAQCIQLKTLWKYVTLKVARIATNGQWPTGDKFALAAAKFKRQGGRLSPSVCRLHNFEIQWCWHNAQPLEVAMREGTKVFTIYPDSNSGVRFTIRIPYIWALLISFCRSLVTMLCKAEPCF